MTHEQEQSMLEKVRPVHHALAGMISTIKLAVEILDARPSVEQAELVEYWQEKYLAAVQQLDDALACFAPAARTAQPVLIAAPRRGFATRQRRAYLSQ